MMAGDWNHSVTQGDEYYFQQINTQREIEVEGQGVAPVVWCGCGASVTDFVQPEGQGQGAELFKSSLCDKYFGAVVIDAVVREAKGQRAKRGGCSANGRIEAPLAYQGGFGDVFGYHSDM